MAELAWPTRCVSCNLPGELLCAECRADLAWIDQRWACPRCGAPHGWLACTGCGADYIHATVHGEEGQVGQTRWETRAVVCALEFAGTAALMATDLKDRHELRLAPIIAAAVATALDEAASWPAADGRPRYDAARTDALCFVPATQKAYARRGFDHMELVADSLSRELAIPCVDLLARATGADQRALGAADRAANLRGSVSVVDEVAGAHLLLVDDVVTTGASMREAARTLLAHGAVSVTGCSLARVW
ncbi:MAG: phosphoribosyltransferase family protein [Olegusella sp.]|nr:phosphoribosyltransferase family protein [Olegusella sp.]